jgi:dihydrodipicolinate synthase/N-acetylneuraminate lyase
MAATDVRSLLKEGLVIPAHPLALTAERRLDERRQRALTRYYVASGSGGVAVGVHTTQFAIRDKGLLRPVLELASAAADEALAKDPRPFVKVAGICGQTDQAVAEASLARACGYDAGLLSLAALGNADDDELIGHCRAVAEVIPVIGFYLQPAVGGRVLGYSFWRRFAGIANVVAVKMAPFNRYQTLDVIRAFADAGRDDVALYTGNDDNIILDLLTPFHFAGREWRVVGGLLGQWAVWTRTAVTLLGELKEIRKRDAIPSGWLTRAAQLTDANGAVFDVANGFRGCIAGIHEVLRRQGLLEGVWCLDPDETLSPGQAEEIDRVTSAYPWLVDDDFVAKHRDEWLA